MKSESKILLIFDTNKIKNNFDWEHDYSEFEPKGDFSKIINWVQNNKLNDLVSVGLPEMVIDEFVDGRYRNFTLQLRNLKENISKLDKLSCADFSQILLPNKDFDYKNYIISKIDEYLKTKNFIIVLKLDKKLYSDTLEIILKKSIIKDKPFNESGKGFKDAIIWEIILNHCEIKDYSQIFLLTENKKDFGIELQTTFKEKFTKELVVEESTESLISTLEGIYNLRVNHHDLMSFLKTEYFKSKLTGILYDTYDMNIENFSVNDVVTINNSTLDDLDEFELSENYSESDLTNFKKVRIAFSNNGKDHAGDFIIESESNEIIALNYGRGN